MTAVPTTKKPRGFAAMYPERQRGAPFSQGRGLAASAGSKGGQASAQPETVS